MRIKLTEKNRSDFTFQADWKNCKKVTSSSVAAFFFLIFFASAGFLLLLQSVFVKVPSLPGMGIWPLISTLLSCFLFSVRKHRFVLSSVVYLCLGFCFFPSFSSSFVLCRDYLVQEAQQLYLYGSAASEGMASGDFRPFLLFLLLLFQYLLFHAVCASRRGFFLFLLAVPLFFSLSFNRVPSLLALGFLLTAFLLSEFCYSQERFSFFRLFFTFAVLVCYYFCAEFLVPAVSPGLFSSYPILKEKVDTAGNTLWSLLQTHSSASPQTPSHEASPISYNGFSYEKNTKEQKLSNQAPSYSQQTMFTLKSSQALSQPLYLRGFIGNSYSDALWTSVSDSRFVAEDTSFRELYNLPYETLLDTLSEGPIHLTLSRQFHNAYHYFPYGAEIPEHLKVTESNRVLTNSSSLTSFSWFSLDMETAGLLYTPKYSSSSLSDLERQYKTYVQKGCLYWPEEGLEDLYEAVSSFSSFPLSSSPSYEEVSAAVQEIQNYLKENASYSLSLETTADSRGFIQDFLFERHTGFCIHFATAGTLMCRMMGIPARYVTGYVLFPDETARKTSGFWEYSIPDSSAHAWTEIYLGSGGWVPVEMTPSSGSDLFPGSSQEVLPSQTPDPEDPSFPADSQSNAGNGGAAAPSRVFSAPSKSVLTFLFVALSVILLLFLLFLLRIFLFRYRMGYFSASPAGIYQTVFRHLMKIWCIRWKLPSSARDQEFFLSVNSRLPEKDLEIFHQLYSQAEAFTFSPRGPSGSDIRTLRQIYRRERKAFLSNCSRWKRIFYEFFL